MAYGPGLFVAGHVELKCGLAIYNMISSFGCFLPVLFYVYWKLGTCKLFLIKYYDKIEINIYVYKNLVNLYSYYYINKASLNSSRNIGLMMGEKLKKYSIEYRNKKYWN